MTLLGRVASASLACCLVSACSLFLNDVDAPATTPQDAGKRDTGIRTDANGNASDAGVTDAGDSGKPSVPFCASRTADAGVVCEDFDQRDVGNGFFGWTPSIPGGGNLEYSKNAYSPPNALHATIPAGAVYAQAYLIRSMGLPRGTKYRVSFMVLGNQPVGGDSLYFSHVFFDAPYPKRYLASLVLGSAPKFPFRVYLSESTQGFAQNIQQSRESTAPSLGNAWVPVEITFDFAAVPAKGTYKVGATSVDFQPIVSAQIGAPDVRLGIEAYDEPGGLDLASDFYFDNFLFEAMP